MLRFRAKDRKELPALRRHGGGVYCLHYSKIASPCPSVFSCSNDFTVCQWRAPGTRVALSPSNPSKLMPAGDLFLKQFSGHGGGVRGALSVGPKLWTCSDDGTLRVWDLATSACDKVCWL